MYRVWTRSALAGILLGALTPVLAGDSSTSQEVAGKMRKLAVQLELSKHAPATLKVFTRRHLLPLCHDPVLVKEVLKQNELALPLDKIKEIDKTWRDKRGKQPIHQEKLSTACAEKLKALCKAQPTVVEAFAMDNRGALVGTSNVTSDFWQGDEPKWKNSYAAGKGALYTAGPTYDESADLDVIYVSLPVLDQNGAAIGALTFALAAEDFE